MLNRLRGNLGVTSALVAMLIVELVALRSQSAGEIILIALCGMLAVLVLVRADIRKVAIGAALACAFTLTWNGWFLGPLRPGDALILLTIVLILVANPNDGFRTPPWWVKQLPIAILLVALLAIFFPMSQDYLANRVVLDAQGRITHDTGSSLASANLGVAFKFMVAVFATPMAFVGAVRIDRRAARWLGVAFACGAALSGWAATLDHFGTDFGRLITRIPNGGSTRQLGFAGHPNWLAAGVVIAIPFAFWLMASTRGRESLIGLICLPGLIGGVYASGSRGGAVCTVGVIALCVIIHPRTRAHLPTISIAGVVLVGFLAGIVPSIGHAILKATRLAGGSNTAGSDTVRSMVGHQGVLDFHHSPIYGIGLQASFDASQVYLQELASGGLILFTAMQLYMLGGLWASWRTFKHDDMAMACFCSLVAILALNLFEADLTDRFYYVPAAILIALLHRLDLEADSEGNAARAGDAAFARADGLPQRRRTLTRM
jgi:hypothetical protein